ncbi:dual specificity phosphatase [Baffinella frigidus]|nr:dual specificity phosphatase [Cryptophyta sp. CCMP2293]|mmetsp:Transcript_58109/g.138700  ORF Transcript_58109/g.138700 Transcript_58109/m.138700 type:complete len:255 (+) Transcript_58109:107-871(+)
MVLKNWGVLAQGVSQDADTLLSPPRGDNVLWLGKERAHTLPGVYAFIAIGALKTAMDPACLEEAGVTHVVNGGAFRYDKSSLISYLDVNVVDSEDTDISPWFHRVNDFVGKAHAMDGLVLIHCRAGRSRSATLAAAYLIEHGELACQQAIDMIKHARGIAQPNPAFTAQLGVFEKECRGEQLGPSLGQITYRLRDGRVRRAGIQRGPRNSLEIVYDGRKMDGVSNFLMEVVAHADEEEDGEDGDSDCDEAGEFI